MSDPNYYGGSAPPQVYQWAMTPTPTVAPVRTRRGKTQGGSHVHSFPIDEGGAQLYPDGPHEYATDLPHGLPTTSR
jgi:hypothetical protein